MSQQAINSIGLFMNRITSYQKCDCGAITLFFEDGANSSMFQETLDSMGIDLSQAEELPKSYCCNHCVNHWGIDLCECGSGEKVGECSCGSEFPVQQFGEGYDSFGKLIQSFI